MSSPVFRSFCAAVIGGALLASLCAPAVAQSRRHLVYDFTVGISNDSSNTSSFLESGGGATSGRDSYNATTSDKGQIAVDIMGMQTDGGLMVSVSETAKSRNEKATTCAVYATTNVVCSDANTNPEIISVLRTLSPKFFNGANLDAKRHWRVADTNAGIQIDFNVTPNSDGTLGITSQRDQTFKGAQPGSIHSTASYVYDPAKYMPTSLKEYTIVREETGPGSYSNITVDLTASLAGDSLKG